MRQADILPVLVTNHTVTIAAELENGRTLVGQCEISHPSSSVTTPVVASKASAIFRIPGDNDGSEDEYELEEADDALGGEAASSVHNVNYTKEEEQHQSLEAPIRRESDSDSSEIIAPHQTDAGLLY